MIDTKMMDDFLVAQNRIEARERFESCYGILSEDTRNHLRMLEQIRNKSMKRTKHGNGRPRFNSQGVSFRSLWEERKPEAIKVKPDIILKDTVFLKSRDVKDTLLEIKTLLEMFSTEETFPCLSEDVSKRYFSAITEAKRRNTEELKTVFDLSFLPSENALPIAEYWKPNNLDVAEYYGLHEASVETLERSGGIKVTRKHDSIGNKLLVILDRLSGRDREIAERYLDGKTQKVIAVELGIKVLAVKRRMRKMLGVA